MTENNVFKEVSGSLVVKSSIRSLIHELGGRSEPEVINELERQVKVLIVRGFERAKENGRSTLLKRDL